MKLEASRGTNDADSLLTEEERLQPQDRVMAIMKASRQLGKHC
jgi:hypothetical protein